jgi:hypothetical protein
MTVRLERPGVIGASARSRCRPAGQDGSLLAASGGRRAPPARQRRKIMVEVPATRPGAADISTSRPWLSVARVGKLMLARPASSGGCILAGRPNEIDTDHSSSGGRCSRSHTSRASCAVLATRLNITSRPSACAPTAIRWGGPPPGAGSADHAFHGPWPGPACRRCHRVPSLVLVNSSSRSSLFRVSADPPISAACTGASPANAIPSMCRGGAAGYARTRCQPRQSQDAHRDFWLPQATCRV